MTSPSGGSRGRTALLAVAVIAVAVVAAGMWWVRRHDRVALLGDSITAMTQPQFEDGLGGDHEVIIDATPGLRTDQMHDAARRVAAEHPDQVVINLGTNDVLQDRDPAAAVLDLQALVDTFPQARCIDLVTVNEQMYGASRADLHDDAATLNQAMRTLATLDPRVRIVDWNAVVADQFARGEPGGAILTDTVHPTPVGQALLVQAYADALASC